MPPVGSFEVRCASFPDTRQGSQRTTSLPTSLQKVFATSTVAGVRPVMSTISYSSQTYLRYIALTSSRRRIRSTSLGFDPLHPLSCDETRCLLVSLCKRARNTFCEAWPGMGRCLLLKTCSQFRWEWAHHPRMMHRIRVAVR